MTTLRLGSSGADVIALQNALEAKGFSPGVPDGVFGPGTQAALTAFQTSASLTPDGEAGPATLSALGLAPTPPACRIPAVSVDIVCQMCPGTPRDNIEAHLPYVLNALIQPSLADKSMVLMAIGTIRAETAGFVPISEGVSQYNTPPGGPDFALYEGSRPIAKTLGNTQPGDGARFIGRGFVQLTGRFNYTKYGNAIGLGDQLVQNPELANDPRIAADLLAAFLKGNEAPIRAALASGDLAQARKLVNGGSHGLTDFQAAYNRGNSLLPDPLSGPSAV